MRHGLNDRTVKKICDVLDRYQKVEQAILYGSRAKGNFRPGSDIDLSLRGDSISFKELSEIYAELDDLYLPYSIDLSVFERLTHDKLKEHIERVGIVLYQRGKEEMN